MKNIYLNSNLTTTLLLICFVFKTNYTCAQVCSSQIGVCHSQSQQVSYYSPIDMSSAVVQPDMNTTDYLGSEVWVSNAGCTADSQFFDLKIKVEQLTTDRPPAMTWNGVGQAGILFNGGGNRLFSFDIEYYLAGTNTPINVNVLQVVEDIDGDCDHNHDQVVDNSNCDNFVHSVNDDWFTATGFSFYDTDTSSLIYTDVLGNKTYFYSSGNDNNNFSGISSVASTDEAQTIILGWDSISASHFEYSSGQFGGIFLDFTAQFTIAQPCAVLPVQMSELELELENENDVNVYWETYSEKNADYFSVEWSTDGRKFQEFETVNAVGNSSHTNSYHATHLGGANLGKVLYYRLRQVDLDGRYIYSPIKSIATYRERPSEIFLVRSNGDGISLQSLKDIDIEQVEVFNILGKKVYRQAGLCRSLDVETNSFPVGLYLVRINKHEVFKVIISK